MVTDKKQIKFGIGCANGLPIDAQVLSGNKDDKTYNQDVLKRINDTLNLYEVDKSQFYYIADSALFSKDNFKAAKKHSIHLITRMPDNVTLCKTLMTQALETFDDLEELTRTNATGQERYYRIMEKEDTLICMDVQLMNHARSVFLKFSKYCPWFSTFNRVYEVFCHD